MRGNHSATSIYGQGKEQRRRNAIVRAAQRAGRTDIEQLNLLDQRPGQSQRERDRILWGIR